MPWVTAGKKWYGFVWQWYCRHRRNTYGDTQDSDLPRPTNPTTLHTAKPLAVADPKGDFKRCDTKNAAAISSSHSVFRFPGTLPVNRASQGGWGRAGGWAVPSSATPTDP